MVRNMLTLRLQLLEVFSFACLPGNVFRKRNLGNENQWNTSFFKHLFLFCGFWNAFNAMQKPLGTEAVYVVKKSDDARKSLKLNRFR